MRCAPGAGHGSGPQRTQGGRGEIEEHRDSATRSHSERNRGIAGHGKGQAGLAVRGSQGPGRESFCFSSTSLKTEWGQQTVQSWQRRYGRGTWGERIQGRVRESLKWVTSESGWMRPQRQGGTREQEGTLTRGHNEAVGERKVEGAGGVSCLRWRGPRRSPEEGGEGRTVPQEGQVFCSKWCPYGSDVPRRSSDYIPSKNAR